MPKFNGRRYWWRRGPACVRSGLYRKSAGLVLRMLVGRMDRPDIGVGTSLAVSSESVGVRETITSSEVAEAAGVFSTVLQGIFQSYVQVSRFGRN